MINPFERDNAAVEQQLKGLLLAWSSLQTKIVNERLDHRQATRGTRHYIPPAGQEVKELKVIKPLDAGYVVELDRWVADIQEDATNVLRPLIKKVGQRAVREAGLAGYVTSYDFDAILQRLMIIVEDSVRKQSYNLQRLVKDLDAEGASMTKIKQAVTRQSGTRSSWRRGLARHLANAATEATKAAVYDQLPGWIKVWNTHGDERVRDSHQAANGQQRRGSERFLVGSAMMLHPLDPSAPISETANCRCWTSRELAKINIV